MDMERRGAAKTLKKNKEFGFAYRRGKPYPTKYFTMICAKSRYGGARAGFSVSKKVGNSVTRNKTRRRLKEAFREYLPRAEGNYSIVFIARESAAAAAYDKLFSDMGIALKKAGVVH